MHFLERHYAADRLVRQVVAVYCGARAGGAGRDVLPSVLHVAHQRLPWAPDAFARAFISSIERLPGNHRRELGWRMVCGASQLARLLLSFWRGWRVARNA